MGILVLGAAWWFRGRPADGDLPSLAVLLLAAVGVGSLVQTLLRLEIACRIGQPAAGHLVLTPIGYRAGTRSGAVVDRGRGSLRVTSGPAVVLLTAAWVLFVALEGFHVGRWFAGGAAGLEGRLELAATARIAAWVWLIQGTAMLLPIPGSAGRQALWGLVERIAARRSSLGVSPLGVGRRVDQIQGALAVLLAAAALWLWQHETIDIVVPIWPFLLALAMLMWAGRGTPVRRLGEVPAAGGAASARGRNERAAVRGLSWWARLRIRQAQRAERSEAVDAHRLDEVLQRLHRDGFDSLSTADRTLLRRVSQRLRQSRGQTR